MYSRLARVPEFALSAPIPHLMSVLVFVLNASWVGPFFKFLLISLLIYNLSSHLLIFMAFSFSLVEFFRWNSVFIFIFYR